MARALLIQRSSFRRGAGGVREAGFVYIEGRRFTVFSIKEGRFGTGKIWTRAGVGIANKDGSLNVFLDVLPIEGMLHVRATAEDLKKDAAPSEASAPEQPQQPLIAAGEQH